MFGYWWLFVTAEIGEKLRRWKKAGINIKLLAKAAITFLLTTFWPFTVSKI